jgi:hypothetical protein
VKSFLQEVLESRTQRMNKHVVQVATIPPNSSYVSLSGEWNEDDPIVYNAHDRSSRFLFSAEKVFTLLTDRDEDNKDEMSTRALTLPNSVPAPTSDVEKTLPITTVSFDETSSPTNKLIQRVWSWDANGTETHQDIPANTQFPPKVTPPRKPSPPPNAPPPTYGRDQKPLPNKARPTHHWKSVLHPRNGYMLQLKNAPPLANSDLPPSLLPSTYDQFAEPTIEQAKNRGPVNEQPWTPVPTKQDDPKIAEKKELRAIINSVQALGTAEYLNSIQINRLNPDMILFRCRVYLSCPYALKEMVKSIGAEWDPTIKKWVSTNIVLSSSIQHSIFNKLTQQCLFNFSTHKYVDPFIDLNPFKNWLPQGKVYPLLAQFKIPILDHNNQVVSNNHDVSEENNVTGECLQDLLANEPMIFDVDAGEFVLPNQDSDRAHAAPTVDNAAAATAAAAAAVAAAAGAAAAAAPAAPAAAAPPAPAANFGASVAATAAPVKRMDAADGTGHDGGVKLLGDKKRK